jgi:acyl-CoA dehydrogenase
LKIDDGSLDEVLSGFAQFLTAEVDSAHASNSWLNDSQAVYTPDGRYSKDTLDLIRQIRERSAAAGFYSMALPKGIGGADLGFEGMYRAWELVFHHCGTVRWLGHHALAHWTKGPSPLLLHAEQSVRDRYLPDLASGSTSMCFAMSEPEAGSDTWMMRTNAERVEGGWKLNGAKQWISNGAHADLAVVFAVTDRAATEARRGGVTAFVVPTSTEGFVVAGVDPMFGHAGSNEAVLYFDDMFVSDEAVLGEPNQGFALAMEGVSLGRIYNCAKSVGLARWALELAVEHAKNRQAFGSSLSEHQGVAFPLAESAIDLHAAHLMSVNCTRQLDAGNAGRRELAMAKVFSTEHGLKIVDRSIQAHGAMGLTNEVGLSEAWQMIRVVCIADGSAEILRRQVAARLFSRGVEL